MYLVGAEARPKVYALLDPLKLCMAVTSLSIEQFVSLNAYRFLCLVPVVRLLRSVSAVNQEVFKDLKIGDRVGNFGMKRLSV